jgi:hypothetical protein
MGKKDDNKPESLKAIQRDDRNLSMAGKRWEETANLDDDAVIFLAQIREDVEKDD